MKVVVCLFDRVAEMYMQPMFVPAIGIAFRNLSDEIARGGEGNVLTLHHADFDLYQVGLWEDSTGEFVTEDFPRLICSVSSLKIDKE